MQEKEILKAKLQQCKTELEQKNIDYISEVSNTKIKIFLSQQISEIKHNEIIVDNDIITAINHAIATAKMNFEKEMMQIVLGLGIKM